MAVYKGQYVFNFTEAPEPGTLPLDGLIHLQDSTALLMLGAALESEMLGFNRILFDQTEEWSHTLGIRPALEIFHELARIEIFGMVNISTKEWGVFPKLTWKASDNLKLSLGGQYFDGPENTRHDWIAPVFNGGFLELRYSF
jgi:hypothetical protein